MKKSMKPVVKATKKPTGNGKMSDMSKMSKTKMPKAKKGY
jgi:hypothetical protein